MKQKKRLHSPLLNEDQTKRALDKSTSYTTLLPHMDEGFHMGYRPIPGILTDGSQKPHEWLESMAKNMQTPGRDVGFAIPDVLASEQQLRRLSRMPAELALRHQQMIDFRALLSLLLIWDQLQQVPGCPVLTVEKMDAASGSFAAMVLGALPVQRAREGLYLVTLTPENNEKHTRYPLCLLSNQTILTPAADPEDLSQVLPPAIRWYDRQRKRFLDPCAYLDESQLALLLPRLRLLMTLCEDASLQSPLYSPSAQLCAPLGRFVDELLSTRQPWRDKLLAGDPEAVFQLRTRVQAVYGLMLRSPDTSRIAAVSLTQDDTDPAKNPLLRAFLPTSCDLPRLLQPQTFYTLDGVPFARMSGVCLLEPTGAEGESDALARIAEECKLLDRYDPDWRAHMAQTLARLDEKLSGRTGLMPEVPRLLMTWQQEYASASVPARQEVTLTYPEDSQRIAAQSLLSRTLGIDDPQALTQPMSDCLMLIEGASRSPFADLVMTTSCAISLGTDQPPLYFLPPISPALCACLMNRDNPALLLPESLSAVLSEDRQSVDVSFRVTRHLPEDGTQTVVTFRRSYRLSDVPEADAAFRMPAAQLPMVTVWPNVRLEGEGWRQYYLHTHNPGELTPLAMTDEGWQAGQERTAPGGLTGTGQPRRWQILQTSQFPGYVPLRLGKLSVGALPNLSAARRIRREAPAAVGLDFGSISTTVMLRQGEKIQPATLPKGLHATLLRPDPVAPAVLENELIPPEALRSGAQRESTFYSVMDLFSDDPEKWLRPLVDGHIYYPAQLSTLQDKNEGTLYYDLKWNEESYVMACLRLFLKQVMMQASLSARLHGSPSLSWRVSTPNAMPPHRQEGYLNLMRGLAREVAQETGVPLTQGTPSVLYASENQAGGLYFRSRNEVSAAGGYLNLDIGGGTADLSLWLGGAGSATAECSLLMGCRQMLFTSFSNGHIDDFEADYAFADPEVRQAAASLASAMRAGLSATRAQQKCMLLMDDFFAAYPEQIRQGLENHRNQGSLAYTECLLLFGLGFLFHLCGVLLHRASLDPELRPMLPARMELCIAGNGGQFLNTLTQEQRERLCQLALSALGADHPLRALMPVQSRDPKLEVATGLLSNDGMLLSTLRSVNRWNGTFQQVRLEDRPNLTKNYLLLFIQTFPQAAERLLGGLYHHKTQDGKPALMPSAEMELATIYENELHQCADDDLTAAVNCFHALKRMWEI
ncbi:MAG: hypothetical protein E7319_05505 [Clostridiales bacterium]|nr:hypothetical protein [Clostridiales bacterium]